MSERLDEHYPLASPVLEARHLTKMFMGRGVFASAKSSHVAFKNVSLSLFAHRTLALVGESGSGKSTLARCLARMEEPTAGELWLESRNFLALRGGDLLRERRKVQLMFQDAMAAMNPHFSAATVIAEPLVLAHKQNGKAAHEQVMALMERVGLPKDSANRGAHEFSGGQKQRIALARAVAANPRVLILDEAFSGLDVVAQDELVELLVDLRKTHGLAYLFISHDLSLVRALADEIAVMKDGAIVECGKARQILVTPTHSYTQSLVSALHDMRQDDLPELAVRT